MSRVAAAGVPPPNEMGERDSALYRSEATEKVADIQSDSASAGGRHNVYR